jgi:hypothetical protein
MPILGNAERAVIDPRKFVDYLLDPASRKGSHKARVFRTVLGYTRSSYGELIAAIRDAILVSEAVLGREDRFGRHDRVAVAVTGPKGSATVVTGWIYDRGSYVPRLSTAFIP